MRLSAAAAIRFSVTVAALVFTVNLWPYGGRPVCDLRFDGYGDLQDPFVASDGSAFLILGVRDPVLDRRTVAQRVLPGRELEPDVPIGTGQPVGLFWNGSTYVAFLQDGHEIRTVFISREGSPLSIASEPIAVEGTSIVVSNGTSALLVTHSNERQRAYVYPLGLDGRPTGQIEGHYSPGLPVAGPSPGGFALMASGLTLLHPDGTVATYHVPIWQPEDGRGTVVIGTNGSETLVVYGSHRSGQPAQLKSVVIGADGEVKSRNVLFTNPSIADEGDTPFGLVWDGSGYILGAAIHRPASRWDFTAPALLRINRDGARESGPSWVTDEERWHPAAQLGWDGRQLLVITTSSLHDSVASLADPITLDAKPPVRFTRTLAAHERVAIAASGNRYFAAWIESGDACVVRGSRIDAGGSYLDGEGLILGRCDEPASPFMLTLAGSDVDWLVLWSEGSSIRGRMVARSGVVAPGDPLRIGSGREAAVQWHDGHYLVLRANGSLYADRVSHEGVVVETKPLLLGSQSITPRIAVIGNAIIAIYGTAHDRLMPGIGWFRTVQTSGLHINSASPVPFTFGSEFDAQPYTSVGIEVISDGTRALVTWPSYPDTQASFLTADAPETPGATFPLGVGASVPSLAFDGTGFTAVWNEWTVGGHISLATARITGSGALEDVRKMPISPSPIRLPAAAASPSTPTLVAYLDRRERYFNVPRAMLTFAKDIGEMPPPPPAPSIRCVVPNDDETLTVSWPPVPDLSGIAIALQLLDGRSRLIGVAPGGATGTRVPLFGLPAGPVRMQAWNGGGASPWSAADAGGAGAHASLRSSMRACAGVPATIEVTLSGTPPFSIRWSDGLVQNGVTKSRATRVVSLTKDSTYRIVSVTDACGTTQTSESIRITIDPGPELTVQTPSVRILPGRRTTLTVAVPAGMQLAWFEGAPGDTAQPVGDGAPAFETPPLAHSTSYWVRVSNACGSVDSEAMIVTVSGKRRAAGR